MAVAFVKAHTVQSEKTLDTTFTPQLDTVVPAGNLIVMALVCDNAATVGKPIVNAIGRRAGETNTWQFLGRSQHPSSTSIGAFAMGELWAIKTTLDWTAVNYSCTVDTAVTMKASIFYEFSGAEATLRSTSGTAYSTTTTAASATTTGTTPVIGDLAVGLMFQSNIASIPSPDSNATGGSWVGGAFVGSSGGSGATNNAGRVDYKILTAASHQTHADGTMTAGNGSIVAILQATQQPAITQAAYRWYDEGTESASTALAAQDTAVTGDIANGDATGTLRIRLQSTTAVAVPTTDDWQLQYEKNASGTWVNVTASSTAAQTYDSPNLTNQAATTNRLTGGTGSFVAGLVSEDSLVDNLGWGANNYTELVYALKIKAADVVAGDTLRFRVRRNNTTTEMTYSQTPTINVIQTLPAVTQAAYRVYADGTETGSTALANQDTAPSINVTTDVNAQVRVRLQSTNVASLPATDDWQLQWEKNASGTWNNPGGTEAAPDSVVVTSVVGSYGTSVASRTAAGQSFMGNGRNLTNAVFWLSKSGTGAATTFTAHLYAHTGTYGSGGIPTGSPLATSTNTVAVASLNTSVPPDTKHTFNFDGTFTLSDDTPYVIVATANATGDATNSVRFGYVSAGTALGNGVLLDAGVFGSVASDVAAEVYTPGGTVVPYASANLTALADSYPVANADTNLGINNVLAGRSYSQTFVGNGGALIRAGFQLKRTGTTDGTVSAALWATSGGVPTGTALATSTTTVAASALPTTATWFDFDFDGSFTMASGVTYAVGVTDLALTTGSVGVSVDSTPTHSGSLYALNPTWAIQSSYDMIFEVTTAGGPTTNRLTGGSGTFTAGSVSVDGLADNVGWAGNNHTELLYSVTLKQADLANGDTLRFRVLRNGATTGFTYTQVPTITVTKTTLTAVQIDLSPTTWNIKGQPTITRSTTWDTIKTISVTRATAWDTLQVVGYVGPVVYDDFVGADSPTAVWNGTASQRSTTIGAMPWTAGGSGNWGIAQNWLVTTTTNGNVTVDLGATDGVIECTFTVGSVAGPVGVYSGICFRRTNASNQFRLTPESTGTNTWTLQKYVAGTPEAAVTGGAGLATPGATYRLRVVMQGAQITFYIDNALVFTYTIVDSVLLTGTRAGPMSVQQVNDRWNDFVYYTAAPSTPLVTITRGTTWDIKQAIPKVLGQTTWNIKQVIQNTRVTTWDTTFVVSPTAKQAIWDDLTVVGGVVGGVTPLAETYPVSNYISDTATSTVSRQDYSQSFLGNGSSLVRAGFYLHRFGSPSSSQVFAYLHRHNGTFGSGSSAPNAPVYLAKSTTSVDRATIPTLKTWVYFDFDPYPMGNGTPYFITLDLPTSGMNSSNHIKIGTDNTSPTHPGIFTVYDSNVGSWVYPATTDMIFEVYGTGVARGSTWRVKAQPTIVRSTSWNVVGGLTQVTVTRSTTWNNDQTITVPRVVSWDTVLAVGITRNTTWDVLLTRSNTRQAIWDATFAITKVPGQTTWKTKQAITKTPGQATWRTRQVITPTVKVATWDANFAYSVPKVTTWDALAIVGGAGGGAPAASTVTVVSPGSFISTAVAATRADTTNVTVTAGDKIVALIHWYGPQTLSSVAGGGLTWTIQPTIPAGSEYHVAFVTADAPAGLASGATITATWNNFSGLYAQYIRLISISGLQADTVPALDGSFYSTYAGASTSPWSVGLTTANQYDFALAFAWIDFYSSGSTPTAPATELFEQINAGGGTETVIYKELSATGSQSIGGTFTAGSATMVYGGMALKKAAAGGTATITRSTTWDDTLAVVKALGQTTWKQQGRIAVTRPTSWNTAGAITQITITRDTTWKVRQAITNTRPTTWDTTLAVPKALGQTTWKIKVAVPKTLGNTAWKIRQAVATTRSTTWDATFAVPKVLGQTTWKIRQAITPVRVAIWDVTIPVAKTLGNTTWKIRGAIQVNRAASWNVAGVLFQVTVTRDTAWKTRQAITPTRPTTWDALFVVTKATGSTTWRVKQAVAATKTTTWDVTQPVTNTRAASWDATKAIANTRATTWDANKIVVNTRQTTWNQATPTLGTVNVVRSTTWTTKQIISQAKNTLWDTTRVLLAATRSTTWDTLKIVLGAGYGAPQNSYAAEIPTPPSGAGTLDGSYGNDVTLAVAGRITGLRHYWATSSANPSKTLRLWSSGGVDLGSVSIPRGTPGSGGWQQTFFSTPITTTAGQTVRVAADHTGNDFISRAFNPGSPVVYGDVTRVVQGYGAAGATGIYPTTTNSRQHFVDVIFEAGTVAGGTETKAPSTTWNVKQPITITRVTTWDVLLVVPTTRSTTWDATLIRSVTRQASWDATLVVGTTRGTSWDALLVRSTARQAIWNQASPTLGTINVVRTTTWNIKFALVVPKVALWDVMLPVSFARVATWDDLFVITRTRATTWNQAAPIIRGVEVSRQAVWDTRLAVAYNRSASWDVIKIVVLTKSTTWQVKRVASATARLTFWNVAEATYTPGMVWDGSALVPAKLLGVWTGTDYRLVVPVGVWNGTTYDPVEVP